MNHNNFLQNVEVYISIVGFTFTFGRSRTISLVFQRFFFFFFVTMTSTEGGGYHLLPRFRYKSFDSYDFGTRK